MSSLETTIASMALLLIRERYHSATIGRDEIAAAVSDCIRAFPQSMNDDQIDRIIADLESKLVVKVGKATTLADEQGHLSWYFGDRKCDRRFYKRYEHFLLHNEGWASAAVDAIDTSTDLIMEQLEDPYRDGPWDRRGLVVGHVQSGKTANYAALANKAADAGYKLIVILAGMHNALRQQTQRRLDRDVLGYDTTPPGFGQGFKPIGVSEFDGSVHMEHLTTQAPTGDFNRAFADNLGMGVQQRPVILVVKKNARILENLNNWVSEKLVQKGDTETRPLIVIDDESDQASIDVGEQSFSDDETPDPDYEPKRINGQIRRLLRAFLRKAYVAYTATPFANILIHDKATADGFGPDLFPRSFIVNLPAPSNYIGPSLVFGSKERDEVSDGSLDIVRHVDQDAEGWITPNHKRIFVPKFDGDEQIPPSLQEAILAFILACAARAARGETNAHNSMLVHVSRFKDIQRRVFSQIDEWFSNIRRILKYRTGGDSLLKELRELWISDFERTSASVRNLGIASDLPITTWEEVDRELSKAADKIRPQIVNSEMQAAIDYEGNKALGLNIIAVGGDKLSRGLTLEGLSVSYFLRASKMYDSLMQMGRWFGYRPGYDLCRVYLTPDLELWFRHVSSAAEELRDRLDEMSMIGATPETYGLRVQSHDVMLVTAQNKMRNGEVVQISFSGEAKIQTVFFNGETINKRNAVAVAAFLDGLGTPDDPAQANMGGTNFKMFSGRRIWKEVGGVEVANLIAGLSFPEGGRDIEAARLSKYIREQITANELTKWTIAIPAGDGEILGVNGWDFRTVGRSPIERTSDTGLYVVKTILSPSDEGIDLTADELSKALVATNKKRTLAGKQLTKRADGPEIRRVRGEDPRRALLILYSA